MLPVVHACACAGWLVLWFCASLPFLVPPLDNGQRQVQAMSAVDALRRHTAEDRSEHTFQVCSSEAKKRNL